MNLKVTTYYNSEHNWYLIESRVFDETDDKMLNANLTVIDANIDKTINDIDDVWVYDWEKIS